MRGISLIADNRLASQEGLCSMEWVSKKTVSRLSLWPPFLRKHTYLVGLYFTKYVEASWNVMAHTQKPDFVFRRNGRVRLTRRGLQFSRLLASELCASAVVMLVTPCSEVVWRVLATQSIRQFPLHFPTRGSSCANTFQLESKTKIPLLLR
jgi:hypothetical protein